MSAQGIDSVDSLTKSVVNDTIDDDQPLKPKTSLARLMTNRESVR